MKSRDRRSQSSGAKTCPFTMYPTQFKPISGADTSGRFFYIVKVIGNGPGERVPIQNDNRTLTFQTRPNTACVLTRVHTCDNPERTVPMYLSRSITRLRHMSRGGPVPNIYCLAVAVPLIVCSLADSVSLFAEYHKNIQLSPSASNDQAYSNVLACSRANSRCGLLI